MEPLRKGLIIAVEQGGRCRYGLLVDFLVDTYLYIRWQDGDQWSSQPELLTFHAPWRAAKVEELRAIPSADTIGPRKDKNPESRADDPKDAEEQRRLLGEYFDRTASESVELGKVFRKFWNALIVLRPDRPGHTWRMRTRTKFGMNPVLLIPSRRTLKDVQLAHFWATTDEHGAWISVIILKDWLPPEETGLFPDEGELYGHGCGVHIKLEDFNDDVLQKYIACFRAIL